MVLVWLFSIPPLNYVYQFFFNLLILFYEALGFVLDNPDMGLAVIALSIFVRLLLLPISLSSRESEEERTRIGKEYAELKRRYKSSDPLRYRKEKEKLIRTERSAIRAEVFNLSVQILIALILFRVFASGLEGSDFPLLYSWVPQPETPLNLMFLGRIDLTLPSLYLNVLTSVLLFILEVLHVMLSPWEPSRNDRLMQIIVPVGVFIYLYSMPSGKKLFVITSLIFSIILALLLEMKDVAVLFWREREESKLEVKSER